MESKDAGRTRDLEDASPDSATLTISAAAARLGVAVPTLRSWERRYGLGPGPAEPGRHRRYTATDMAVLTHFCHLVAEGVPTPDAARAARASTPTPTVLAPPRPPATTPHSARGLARAAIRLDSEQVLTVLEETIDQAGVVAAWEQTIKPALLAVSRKWTETEARYVEVEHLLSWCITVALHRVRPTPAAASPRSARPVLLACAPNEWHSLPLDVLNAALTQQAVSVRMLGAAVPTKALSAAITRLRPARVVIWSQTPNTADPAALPTVTAAQPPRSPCRILPAGPGWQATRPAVPAVLLTLPAALEACLT